MQVGGADAAFMHFREMQGMGLRPNQKTYGSLLHGCAQIGNHKSAARVMQMMRSAGIRPTVEAYTSLMDACVKANTPDSHAQAFQVGLCLPLPSARLSDSICLISLLARAGRQEVVCTEVRAYG